MKRLKAQNKGSVKCMVG